MVSTREDAQKQRRLRQAGIGLLMLLLSGMMTPASLAQQHPESPRVSLVRYFELPAWEATSLEERQHICLIGVSMSADRLSRLGRYQQILTLELQGCVLPSQGFPQIAQIRQLRELSLVGTAIRDEHLPCFIDSPHLAWLDLRGTCITDQGLSLLAECPSLIYLDLRGTAVTASAVRELKRKRPDLEILFLPAVRETTLAHRVGN